MLKFIRALIAMDNAVKRTAEKQRREAERREAMAAKIERENRAARVQDLRIELLEIKLERERERTRQERELSRLLAKGDLTPEEYRRAQYLQANR